MSSIVTTSGNVDGYCLTALLNVVLIRREKMWNNKELTEQIINQVRDKRVMQLEEALDEALNCLEALMGCDYYESETTKRIEEILNRRVM